MKKTSIFGKWVLGLFTGLCFLAGGNLTAQNTYVKVTSESDLTAGSQYLIVCESEGTIMAGQVNSNYRGYTSNITVSSPLTTSIATNGTDNLPFEITLETGENGAWYLYDAINGKYLTKTNTSNYLQLGNQHNWTISFDGGNASIQSEIQKDDTYFTIQYNANKDQQRFSCYTSTQKKVQLYKKQEAAPGTPTVSLQPGSLNLSTTPNNTVTETITVTGANLTSNVTVAISGDNADLFKADATTLTASEIMAEGGKELTITYTPTEAGNHTATLTLSSEELAANITATLNGSAVKEIASLADLMNEFSSLDKNQIYTITGNVIVTAKETNGYRVWVEDANKEDGGAILLYQANSYGGGDLSIGDVISNVTGKLDEYNDLYELLPTQTLTKSGTVEAYVADTMTIAEFNAADIDFVQNKLICLSNVQFEMPSSGKFDVDNNNYTLTDGSNKVTFYASLDDADYQGQEIPEGELYVTGIVSLYKSNAQITARSMADMVPAPCPVPTNLFADGITATSATISFQSEVGSYALRYATSEEALADAEPVTFNENSKEITGLTPETQYFFQVKAICTPETHESEWSTVQNFTTLAEATPAMTVLSPAANAKIDTAIRFAIRTQNFELGTDGHFMVSVRGEEKISENNDSVIWLNLVSSQTPDTAIIRLVDMEGDTLESGDIKAIRIFTIDLKDVATPSFEPAAGSYTDSVEVSIACATEGASLFYALGDAEYESYTKAILLKENATVRAMAVKAGMDTSYAEAEYTIRTAWIPSEDTVLFEPFDAFTAGNADDETNPADGNDIADSLDTYTLMPGWTGERVYQSLGTAKMGGSSKAGYIQLPALNLSEKAGSFAISFMAKAWNNDATSLNLIVNGDTTVVEGLDNKGNSQDNMKPYEFVFSNGTESTSIRFAAKQASKARFFLDDVCVYFVPEEPTLMVAETVNMEAILGDTTEESINVRGLYLTEDVKIACESSNFYTDSASLNMGSVMSENGSSFNVYYKGIAIVDSTTLTLTSGELSQTIKVYARAIERTEVANLAALYDYYEDLDKEETFRVTGEIVVTHTDAFNTRIWAQDADMTDGASILIFRAEDYGFENIKAGDVIEGLTGTMEVYNNLLEFLPTETLTVSESGRALHVDTLSFAEIEANILDYQSALVCVEDVVFAAPDSVFATGTNYDLVQESDTLVFRTDYYNADYIGTAMPTGNLNITGILTQYFENAQITARNLADIVSVPTANEVRETIASRLYPNPTSGMFYLDIERDARVDIFSANGALVESIELTAGLHEMNLDQKGIYFVRISNGKAVTVKRVIVL